ncbi:MAG TPA: helix-turn-helix domain-containing protein [Solirubrobacterales bacterium]
MTRPYRKRARAAQEEETRLRITEAAIELHGSVGPARTTVSAVAERAGVQRATVYRHFPTEADLFAACTSHWAARNRPPDPTGWTEVRDPGERLHLALGELYGWYGRAGYMLERAARDAPVVESLKPALERTAAYFEAAREILLAGRPERGARRRRVSAAIGHAISLTTWRSLVVEQGLAPAEAVELAAGMADAA